MTAPTTPLEVVRQLSALTRELARKVQALRTAEHDAAVKRHSADMAESRAFLNADGAMDMRRHIARLAADEEEGAARVAEALVRVLKAEIRELETRIDVGRTYASSIRAEMQTLGVQP